MPLAMAVVATQHQVVPFVVFSLPKVAMRQHMVTFGFAFYPVISEETGNISDTVSCRLFLSTP